MIYVIRDGCVGVSVLGFPGTFRRGAADGSASRAPAGNVEKFEEGATVDDDMCAISSRSVNGPTPVVDHHTHISGGGFTHSSSLVTRRVAPLGKLEESLSVQVRGGFSDE